MNFYYIFIILGIIINIKADFPTIEIANPNDQNDVIITTALFTKLNWIIMEIEKLNKNLFDLNKRLDLQENSIQNCCKNTCDFKPVKQNRNWLVILRRQDGSENFDRNWTDYKNGFGNPNGEFFIGLEKLHSMTTYGDPQELLVVLQDFDNQTRYAKYDEFVVGNETEKYKLNKLGKYSGDAGDALYVHLNQKFTTKDNENDEATKGNCAEWDKGGWWYRSCSNADLTGPYSHQSKLSLNDQKVYAGISWTKWHDTQYSLKFAEMIIRSKL